MPIDVFFSSFLFSLFLFSFFLFEFVFACHGVCDHLRIKILIIAKLSTLINGSPP